MSKIRPLILVVVTITIVGSWGVTSPASSQSDETDADPTMAAIETQIAQLEATGTALAVQPTSTSTAAATDEPVIRQLDHDDDDVSEGTAAPTATVPATSTPTASSESTCESPSFSLDPIELEVTSAQARVTDNVPGASEPSRPYLVVTLRVQSTTSRDVVPPVRSGFPKWEVTDGNETVGLYQSDLSYQATSNLSGTEELLVPPGDQADIMLDFEISREPITVSLRNPAFKDLVLAGEGYKICYTPPSEEFVYPTVTPTIAATATAVPTRTATPRGTTPRRTPTSGARSSGNYPASVQRIVNQDNPTRCDEIGWTIGRQELQQALESDPAHYFACGEIAVAVACFSLTDTGSFWAPDPGDAWVYCFVIARNLSSDPIFVSPLDFTLIDGSNRRYSLAYEPLVGVSEVPMFPTDLISPSQDITGMVAFTVPQTASEPFRLEVTPDFGLGTTLTFILDPMVTEADL